MEEGMKQRLIRLLKEKHMTQTEFAHRLGVTPTYVGAMRKGMSKERLKTVFEMFPDLNRDWLLYGEGEMLLPEDTDMPDLTKGYIVPMLPVEAFAGNLQLWSEGVQLRDCEKTVSPVPGVDFGIRLTGDSMEPELQNGSILFIKRINEKAFIPWGNPMVIDSENGVVVKVVYPVYGKRHKVTLSHVDSNMGGDCDSAESRRCDSEEEMTQDVHFIEARSYNPKYPPFLIPTGSIYGLYRVVTAIRQYSTL